MTTATKTRTKIAAPRPTEPALPVLIGVGQLDPHPENPRQEFPTAELQALAGSLTELEMLSPLQVEADGAGRFRILSGERRWRAAKLAGWREVPCYVRKLTRAQAILLLAEDNLQHRELNAIETARAVALLLKPAADGGAGLTAKQIAARFGKADDSWTYNMVRLLRLPPVWQEEVRAGGLNARQARTLTSYVDKPEVLAAVAADRAANPNDWKGTIQFEDQLIAVAQRVEQFTQSAGLSKESFMPASPRKSPAPAKSSKGEKCSAPPPAAPPPAPAPLTLAEICAAIRQLTDLAEIIAVTDAAHARSLQLRNNPSL